jgi:mono/diheme cytochrome c family protein
MNAPQLSSFSKTFLALALASASTFALAQSSDWRAPAWAANRPNPVPPNANTLAVGKKLYVDNCLGCHGPQGKGDGPTAAVLQKKPANLGARIEETGERDGELFWKISEGHPPMPRWKATPLSETQRWKLVNYIRATFTKEWRAPASAANWPNPVPLNATTIALGQRLYVANCVKCHGKEGKGDGPGAAALEEKPANLPARIKETGETDGELFWKISEGHAAMPKWKATPLSEMQRWQLVNYIRATFGKLKFNPSKS